MSIVSKIHGGIIDIWYNKIVPKIIINGFKKTGITVNDDGNEDDLATEACLEVMKKI